MDDSNLYEQYSEDVARFIYSKVKDAAVTKDLVQDTFVKIYSKIDGLRDRSKIKSWILSIARNTTIDYLRIHQSDSPLDDVEWHEEETVAHCEKDCLPNIINELPEKYATPLILSDIEGMKQQDIADQLAIPLSTVKSQIQRARKMVAEGYVECCGYTYNDDGKLVGETKDRDECLVCKDK